MKKLTLLFCTCMVMVLPAFLYAQEVDYASRFYELRYCSSQNYYSVDSVEVLNIYGDVFYRGEMYTKPYELLDHDSLLLIREENGWVTYEASGKIIKTEPYYNLIHSKEGMQGLSDNTGKVLIPPIYDEIEYGPLATDKNPFPASVVARKRKGDKMMEGIVSIDNEILLPFEYSYIYTHKNFTLVEKEVEIHKNGESEFHTLSGFIDWCDNEKKVKILTDCVFDVYVPDELLGRIVPYGNLIPVKNPSTGLLGYVDKYGKIVIPYKYSDVSPYTYFDDENYTVLWCKHSNDRLYDLFDAETGERLLFDCEEWQYDEYYGKHRLWGKKKNIWYCIDCKTKKTLYSFACETTQWLSNIWYKTNNVWNCIDIETGKALVSLNNVDDILWDFKINGDANYACIKQDNRVGIIDPSTGKVIVPCQYSYEKDVKFLVPIYSERQEYVIYVDKQNHTIYFIRLTDGKIVKTFDKVSDIKPGPWYPDNTWVITDMEKNIIFCTTSGQVIVGPDYQTKELLYVGPDFIVAKSVGIFDYSGNLLLNLGEDCGNIQYYNSGDYMLPGLSVHYYNKKNGTRRDEYYYYDEGKLKRMESSNDLYRYYYAQCQEKFRNQPSDVDKNIPVATEKKANTYVYIIANENYASATDVPFGLNDGRSFKEYCEKTLGILPNHIKLYENATTGQVITCVEQMKRAAAANNGDIDIIFYYAGHAFSDEDKNACLLPTDGDPSVSATGYSLDRLYDELGQLQVNSIICFIDACYSGATRDDKMLQTGRALIVQPKAEEPRGNMVVFSASSGNETAHQYQSKKHGMFTYYLLKKLQESNGNVTLGELSKYIEENVKKMSFEINERPQNPTTMPSPAMVLKWKGLWL